MCPLSGLSLSNACAETQYSIETTARRSMASEIFTEIEYKKYISVNNLLNADNNALCVRYNF